MEIKIRKMQTEDTARVAAMNELLSHSDKKAAKEDAAFFEEYGMGPKRLANICVAVDENNIAGFIVTRDWASFGAKFKVRQIDLLYVDENYRGMGVASDLLSHVIIEGVKDGCGRIDIQTEASNEDSNALYKKLGFKHKADTRNFYQMLPAEQRKP